MKLLKTIILPIAIPLVFVTLGVIGVWAFIVLLFNEEKRRELFGG